MQMFAHFVFFFFHCICISYYITPHFHSDLNFSSFDAVGAREQHNIMLSNKTNGILNHLNYPQPQPTNIDFTQHIVAPLGEVILLELYNVGISESGCHNADRIEVRTIMNASPETTKGSN